MLPNLKTLDLRGYSSSVPIRLMIESNSLETIDASTIHSDMKLNFTRESCPNLNELAVFVDRDYLFQEYYCPIEVGNELFLHRLSNIMDKILYEQEPSDEERSNGEIQFCTRRTDTELLSTLDIPEAVLFIFKHTHCTI